MGGSVDTVGILEALRDALGGGTLSLWVVVAGLVAVWIAVKAVSMLFRLAAIGLAVALFASTAPWAGADLDTREARCAAAAVAAETTGWRGALAKRITVEEVSDDATCADGGVGLATGSAVVQLRSFYDLPFQTWDVDREGAEPRFDVSQLA